MKYMLIMRAVRLCGNERERTVLQRKIDRLAPAGD
jgi:hypothetical protein